MAVLMVGVEEVEVAEMIDGVCTGEAFDIDSGDDESIAVETVENSAVTVLEIVSST